MDTTVTDPLIGASLEGRYRVTERVASGGMADVYRAVDERLDRVVAVKIIHRSQAADAGFLARFAREAKTIARLSHPNVVSVFDTGSHDGLPYLVMEYVNGRTLRDVLAEHERLPARHCVRIAEKILSALAAAHRVGLVHRDVKPENVLLAESGAVKVADFGLARMVAAEDEEPGGSLLATVAYVPPELVADGLADARSDVYSAGIVLYEMLTGTVPFDGPDSAEVAARHVHEDVPAPSSIAGDVPADLDALVVAATRRDRDGRPADAAAFADRLAALAPPPAAEPVRRGDRRTAPLPTEPVFHGRSAPATPPPRRPPGTLPERLAAVPRRVAIVLGAAALAMLLVGATGWWFSAGRYESSPSLLGLTAAEAEAAATDAGFTVAFDGGDYSETVPRDTVLAQNPEPGEQILDGDRITVTLSLGPERYTIPALKGENGDDAVERLEAIRQNITVAERYDDTVPAGTVLGVDPPPGTQVRSGQMVTLTVSAGPAPVKVVDVIGRDGDEAKGALEELGLVVTVVEEYHDQVDAGEVFAQNPPGGTGVADGSGVTITVSKGPEPVVLPDVVGRPYEEARGELQRLGFHVERFDLPLGNDEVFNMSPDGGTTQPKGSTVTLYTY